MQIGVGMRATRPTNSKPKDGKELFQHKRIFYEKHYFKHNQNKKYSKNQVIHNKKYYIIQTSI